MAGRGTVVIGGGIIGLASAYELARAGRDVHVVERTTVGTGSSNGNAGWISLSHCYPVPAPGAVREALRTAGRADAPLYVRPSVSPSFLRWLYEFGRHCRPAEFRRGATALLSLAAPTDALFDAWAAGGVDTTLTRPGLVHAFLDEGEAARTLAMQRGLANGHYAPPDSLSTGAEIQELEPALGSQVRAAYLVAGEGLVDPTGLVEGLITRIREMGVRTHERTTVSDFVVEDGRVRAVVVDGQPLDCDDVVIAAGTWSADVLGMLGAPVRMQAGKGYSFAVDLPVAPKHPILLADKHVAVSPIDSRTRISGTMEFSGNNRRLDWRRVEAIAAASQHYLGRWYASDEDLMALIEDPWVGGRPMRPNGLPLIDRVPGVRNAYVATAHGMLGVTLAPTTASALTQFMTLGVRPVVLEPFSFGA